MRARTGATIARQCGDFGGSIKPAGAELDAGTPGGEFDRGLPAESANRTQTLAVRRGRPVVEFADHDQCRNDEFLGGNAAKRVVGHGGLELSIPGDVKDFRLMVRRQLQRNHCTLRISNNRDTLRIDEGKIGKIG